MSEVTAPKLFFFINKSERSTHLSRSLPVEKAAVQRHVQTGRKRTRARQRTDQTPGSQPAPEAKSWTSPSADTLHKSLKADFHNRGKVKTVKGSCVESDDVLDSALRPLASPLNELVLCKQDPFNAASVRIDKRVGALLNYYVNYYHPSQWPNEMVLLRHGVYMFRDAVSNIMRTVIADKLAMYCLLSSAASRLQFIDRLPSPLLAGQESFYIQEALHLLKSYIATGNFNDDDQLKHCLVCIGFLNSAESYRGNLSASKVHFEATVRLLEPIGGLAAVKEDNMRGQIAMADLFLACAELRPCRLEPVYDPGNANTLRLLDYELRPLNTSHIASALLEKSTNSIPAELIAIIRDLVESYSVKSCAATSAMSPARAMQVTHWITLRNMAIRNRLLRLQTADARIDALRISIVMWTLLAMNITGRARTVKMMAPQLKSRLAQISSSSWMGNEGMKLWILLVGFHCVDDSSKASSWFLEKCSSCILPSLKLACTTELFRELEIFQKGYFYDARVQHSRTRILAERLLVKTVAKDK